MSIRYFRSKGGGVSQVGNLTDEGAQVLAGAGHEEIAAEEYQAAVDAAQAETAGLLQPVAQPGKRRGK